VNTVAVIWAMRHNATHPPLNVVSDKIKAGTTMPESASQYVV
jgi:hypothetical protein